MLFTNYYTIMRNVLSLVLLAIVWLGTASHTAKDTSCTAVKEVFIVSSLNNDGTENVTLTITISASGAATVSKSTSVPTAEDVTRIHMVGNDLDFIISSGNPNGEMTIELEDNIPDQELFWIDIELDDEPSVPNGRPTITYWCESSGCPTEARCEPVALQSGNKANVTCSQSCNICILKSKSGTSVTTGGGVYIAANSVTYN